MKSGFLEKLIGRLGRIGPDEVQNYFLRLAQEKGFLETVFNTIQEGIIVTDSNGRITYLNDAACELFGLQKEDSIGKCFRSERISRDGFQHDPGRNHRDRFEWPHHLLERRGVRVVWTAERGFNRKVSRRTRARTRLGIADAKRWTD